MTRALITGAAGFIGSHVADECLRLGMEVVATDSLSGGFFDNVPADVTWVEGDISDPDFVESLWESRTYRLRVPHGGVRGGGTLALHPRLQLPHQPPGERAARQPVGAARGQAVRLYVVDRGLRGRARLR